MNNLYDRHLEELWVAQNAHNEAIGRAQEDLARATAAYDEAMTKAQADYARVVGESRDRLGAAVHARWHGEEVLVKLPNVANTPKTRTVEMTFTADTGLLTTALKAVNDAINPEAPKAGGGRVTFSPGG